MTHRPRRRSSLIVIVAVVGATLATTAATAAQSSAGPPTGAQASEVISGDARFEVLSPTLIRTEYAGDAHFVDAPTFNAIGRDGFTRTPYATSTGGGWLTIATEAMTLRYQVGSGAFGKDNLSV